MFQMKKATTSNQFTIFYINPSILGGGNGGKFLTLLFCSSIEGKYLPSNLRLRFNLITIQIVKPINAATKSKLQMTIAAISPLDKPPFDEGELGVVEGVVVKVVVELLLIEPVTSEVVLSDPSAATSCTMISSVNLSTKVLGPSASLLHEH